ncbi:MAG: hypothetical protein ABH815_02020 [Candidatus Omnitrophota bacterium]
MAELTPEGKLLDLIKQAQGNKNLKKELKIFTNVNIILIGLIAVILAVFLIDIVTSDYNIPELRVDFLEQEGRILPKPVEFSDDVEDVNIVPEKKPSVSKEDVLKNLNLLGIVAGDDNQAIIEDLESKKTHFLYTGDNLGEYKVLDIKDNKVLLEYKGEKIELRM